MSDTTFEVVWEVTEATNYRATFTATDIADYFGIDPRQVTTELLANRFEELVDDEQNDANLDDGPDVTERTLLSVRPSTAPNGAGEATTGATTTDGHESADRQPPTEAGTP